MPPLFNEADEASVVKVVRTYVFHAAKPPSRRSGDLFRGFLTITLCHNTVILMT